jgi:hypothetical protein
MAKKAKSGKTKAKAKSAPVIPTYMTGTKPLKIGLHDVIKVLEVIGRRKRMGKFKTAAKKNNAVMLVEPATVNFVKDFMVKNGMHNHPVGKHVVNARDTSIAVSGMRGAAAAGPPKDPFECDLSKH